MINKTFFLFTVFIFIQVATICQPDMVSEDFADYQEPALKDRRFKHADIQSLILQLPDNLFDVTVAGHSVEGREIYLIKAGQGKTKVLLWSQMHGNEPTATMALFDIFIYLKEDQSAVRNQILKDLTLYFIPMLNPDGADDFQRRNALDIDINRDALRLTSPESKILKSVRDELEPEWGFNLHDQNRYTSAGKTNHTAGISFLAPAFNEEKDWNPGRTAAMQLICQMNAILQKHIPGKVGRYSDEFEPRAFGDNIQKWGTNTILIETGALPDDPEKQYLRKLNYISLLSAFQSIVAGTYKKYKLADYENIPFNQSVLHDLIIRNATIEMFDQDFLFDLGFRRDEIQDEDARTFYLRSYLSDLGDLHNYYGYEEYDATGMMVQAEKHYDQIFSDLNDLKRKSIGNQLAKGFTTFQVTTLPASNVLAQLPFRLVKANTKFNPSSVKLGQSPVLTFWKDGTLKEILVNGTIHHWDTIKNQW